MISIYWQDLIDASCDPKILSTYPCKLGKAKDPICSLCHKCVCRDTLEHILCERVAINRTTHQHLTRPFLTSTEIQNENPRLPADLEEEAEPIVIRHPILSERQIHRQIGVSRMAVW